MRCGEASAVSFFDGFELEHIVVGDVRLRVRHGGSGPPALLLHGHSPRAGCKS
jgi:hypothetical protein